MNGIPLRKIAIACAVALSGATPLPLAAQEGAGSESGVYSHTLEGETYLQRGPETLELQQGESGFANEDQLNELDIIPRIIANDRSLAPGGVDQLSSCGVYPDSNAALGDQPLQSDFDRFDRQILDEIDRFLNEGYPPASVLLHAASTGIALDRALFAAVRSQPTQAEDLYMAALELTAFLPGWTCAADIDRGMYDPVYDVNALPEERRVRDVARRYFEDRSRLAQFPDWPNEDFHILASADELLDMLAERDAEHWYRAGPAQEGAGAHPRDSVLIGLYPETRSDENENDGDNEGEENESEEGEDRINDGRIVIDTSADQIRQWKAEGRERIPVTFFYNLEYQNAISQFDDDATLEDIMEVFFEDGEELTPVPLFTVGDYHMTVPGEHLEELFELPESDEIEPARYQELADDLSTNGFRNKPVMVSLLRSSRYRRLAEPDRVRVALDQGNEQFPVAVFYHRLGRERCGSPAICFEQICDALVCAGGDPNACLDPAAAGAVREAFIAPTGGGGGAPPPPPPPPPASPS